MKCARFLMITAVLISGCVTEAPYDPLVDYEEVDASTILAAPRAMPGSFSPQNRNAVARGKYMVELLGCGVCHTNGALVGDPDLDRALAGSQTGIAYASPLGDDNPGVVYPPNITPDDTTGIGGWTDSQVANAIRAGIGRHSSRRITYMPWQGYARLSDEDVNAIVSYLRSIEPVYHQVPKSVEPGEPAKQPFVYFGVYRSKR
ncbi:MAG: cytochrome c [Gammaproteobacteria bacterium]|nr:cytochrome c [Gammaproteobacteria bacterium]